MEKERPGIAWLVLLLVGLLLLVTGAASGNFRVIHQFASKLCLSCMGFV
ncbi:hypothetical protein JXB37_06305 [candidate division WOR-3 bacterium]|nr:hypothetical protein [candidate division WOR-3 bacterium]